MIDYKILEAVADIAYIFGEEGYFSGDSRRDVLEIIHLANEFENKKIDWTEADYHSQIHEFAITQLAKLRIQNSFNS